MATITGNVIDIGAAWAVVWVRFQSVTDSAVAGASLVDSGAQSVQSDASGNFSKVLAEGNYDLYVNEKLHSRISVPAGGGSYVVTTRIISSGVTFAATPVAGAQTTQRLIEQTEAGAFQLTNINRDSDGVITTATVLWPDGSAGVFTTTQKDAAFQEINAYTITHADTAKTITQTPVTRDLYGNVVIKPALSVS